MVSSVASNIPLPSTVWLAPVPPDPPTAARPAPGLLLPGWALRRIHAEFAPRPSGDPLPVLRLQPTTTDASPAPVPAVLVTELPPGNTKGTGGSGVDLPGFLGTAFHHLRHGGFLLVACRQHHREDGEVIDPCGEVIATARAAGFVYRQHILIIHATALGGRLRPTPDAPADEGAPFWRHRTIHTDLLMFTPA